MLDAEIIPISRGRCRAGVIDVNVVAERMTTCFQLFLGLFNEQLRALNEIMPMDNRVRVDDLRDGLEDIRDDLTGRLWRARERLEDRAQ